MDGSAASRDIEGPAVTATGRRDGSSISPASSSRPASSTATAMSDRRRAIRNCGNTRSTASPPRPACASIPTTSQEFKAQQKAGDLRGARILTVKYRFMSAPCKPGSEYKTPEEARAKVDEIAGQGRRLRQGLDRRPGRPPSEAHAGIHRRRDGSGEEAQQDHDGAYRRARRRAAHGRPGRQHPACTTCATRTFPTISSPR